MPQSSSKRTTRSSNSKTVKLTGPSAIIVIIIVALVYLYQAWQEGEVSVDPDLLQPLSTEVVDALPSQTDGQVPSASAAQEGQGISVWFSDPLAKLSTGGPENHLVDAIQGAQKSVDVAIYNLTIENVGEALLAAKQRGVNVRIVMESEAMDKDLPQQLQDAGIPIVGDQREALMHDKFTIIDGKEVWMGSMNYTSTSAYKDFNNLVRFQSVDIVKDYQAEFDQMFTQHLFGPSKASVVSQHAATVDGIAVQVYFSPEDGVADHIIEEIQNAKKEIRFLAYSFTSDDIAQAIKSRAADGVTVQGVFDEGQNKSNKGGEYASFLSDGYDVRIDGISGLLHDKVIIIDRQTVITGSYNFSASAEKSNDENLVIIHDANLAELYLKHFTQVYESAQK